MPKNIFYFNNGAIGDFLMTLFFMENIRQNFSQKCEVNCFIIVAKNKNILSSLCRKYKYINIIEFNKKNFFSIIFFILRFIFGRNYIITQQTIGKIPLSIKIISKLISLNKKSFLIGFDDREKINKFIYDRLLKFDPKILFFENIKVLVREVGFDVKKETPNFSYEKSNSVFKKYNLAPNNYIVLHPFSNNPLRNLPLERWVNIIQYLLKFNNIKLIITGSSFEEKIGEKIISKINSKNNIFNLSGLLSMQELANIIDNAKLFIGVDSGITHLAGVLHKKSLVIGNYSNPYWLPYYNKNAVILYDISACPYAPCNKKFYLNECKTNHYKCMMDISQDLIEMELKKIFL